MFSATPDARLLSAPAATFSQNDKKVSLHTLKRLRKKLYKVKADGEVVFVYGIGHRKSQLQKSVEELEYYIDKLKEYDPEKDCYICAEGRILELTGTTRTKTKSGYVREISIYSCKDCSGCSHKSSCIKGNNCKTPLEERCKVLNVSKVFAQKRKECLERIVSDEGCKLRMNRSIQAEGSF